MTTSLYFQIVVRMCNRWIRYRERRRKMAHDDWKRKKQNWWRTGSWNSETGSELLVVFCACDEALPWLQAGPKNQRGCGTVCGDPGLQLQRVRNRNGSQQSADCRVQSENRTGKCWRKGEKNQGLPGWKGYANHLMWGNCPWIGAGTSRNIGSSPCFFIILYKI